MALRLKLVPDDPRHAEYRDLRKTPDGVAKTDLSIQMRKILEDDSLSDDVKIKLYRRTLDRFLSVSDSAPAVERQSATNALSPINNPPATTRRKRRRTRTDWVTF